MYKKIFKRKLDLDNPRAFTEKLAWLKIFWKDELAKKCADKIDVRDYVIHKIGIDYLIPEVGEWNSIDEVNFDTLPSSFVLKPSNGSGDVVICKDKKNLDVNCIIKRIRNSHAQSYFRFTKEWVYYDMPKRILVEELIMGEDGGVPNDYKLFCFNGSVKIILVVSERGTETKENWYSVKWEELDIYNGKTRGKEISKPFNLRKLIEVAEKLAEDFPFVRVDLFTENEKIYFGELTFFPNGGFVPFNPEEVDYELGKWLILPNKEEN
ncbi:hypothetical protein RV10_GL002923 [Enterococcus pallens]|nr:hypothetical protein RV10_GL002923 [Enterococcus pallens]